MRKKGAIICVAAAMALSAVGFGFAKWSSAVNAKVTPNTGSLNLGWVQGSFMNNEAGVDGDLTADQGLVNIRAVPEAKEVGSTSGSFEDTNGDGILDRFNVTIDNAYPYYYNEISGKITTSGSVPLIIQKPILNWLGNEKALDDGFVYWLGKDGQIIQPTAAQIATPVQVGDNWVLEIRWMDNAGRQMHTPQTFEESFELQVLQAAEQGTKYEFGLSVEGIQWNEIR